MTDQQHETPGAQGRRDRRRWRRPGPVGTFGLLAMAAAAVLVALQATGAVAPQVHDGRMAGGGTRRDGRSFYVSQITNDGTLPVRILTAAWFGNGTDTTVVMIAPPGSSSTAPEPATRWADQAGPFRPLTLQGGEHRLVYLVGRPGCSPTERSMRPRLQLRARPAFGPTRTISIDTAGRNDLACPGP